MDPTTEDGIQAISEMGDREPINAIQTTPKVHNDEVKNSKSIKLNLRIRLLYFQRIFRIFLSICNIVLNVNHRQCICLQELFEFA